MRREAGRGPAFWRDLYASVDDPDRFRAWLRALLTRPGAGHLPEGYQDLPMCGQVGFMTFRVLRLFTDWTAWQDGAVTIRTPDDARAFYDRYGIVDHVLRTERIEADLDRLLTTLGVPDEICTPTEPVKGNESRRNRHINYYDDETASLVQEKDRVVIEAFGYTPPDLAR